MLPTGNSSFRRVMHITKLIRVTLPNRHSGLDPESTNPGKPLDSRLRGSDVALLAGAEIGTASDLP